MSRIRLALAAVAATLIATSALAAPPADLPAAIFTDPPADAAHPARMEVLHIPSHGVEINGVAYLAAGPGPHPTVVLFHGLPGNEKNLDLAQAIRRAGWHAVTFNYRGAWGSPGVFRFRQNLEDADATLAYIRTPAVAAKLGIDTGRLVILGHSMGGWVVINTAAHDHGLAGLVTYSAADMGDRAGASHAALAAAMANNKEALAGVTADSMADDIATLGDTSFAKAAPGLKNIPYLDLTSDDGLAASDEALAAAIRAEGGTKVSLGHAATDHGWSSHRIDLEARVITWLQALK
ncbi:S9 family peptidase [Phenylobacterium aquaticum]|uniref:alpha/beta hydrolase family protein n=1 Tax=Phenylobacterium aquaticum TaxID=1763816 RepID=UPI0026F349BD|nr:alpha/beta fold hydrolase [Phenylobacterium aquaticum]